jgi:hypothetical protein
MWRQKTSGIFRGKVTIYLQCFGEIWIFDTKIDHKNIYWWQSKKSECVNDKVFRYTWCGLMLEHFLFKKLHNRNVVTFNVLPSLIPKPLHANLPLLEAMLHVHWVLKLQRRGHACKSQQSWTRWRCTSVLRSVTSWTPCIVTSWTPCISNSIHWLGLENRRGWENSKK